MSPLRAALAPVLRPVFYAWWRLRRGMTLGVRAIAIDAEGRVLLVRHTYVPGWHLPGGGVEKGETCETALRRELAEEGGLEALGAPVLLGIYSQHAVFPNDHVLVYRVPDWRPCAAKSAGEIAERGFFALDSLPDGVTRGTRARLAEALNGAPTTEAW